MAAADARTAVLAQLVILAVFFFAFYDLPSILLRFAASFLAPSLRLYFLAFIVITLFLNSYHDTASSSPSFADPSGWPSFHHFRTASSSPSFADPSGWPSSNGDAPQHAFHGRPQPPIIEAELSGEEAPPEEVVFEDKEVVYVKTVRAQPPRRTMSQKTHDGGEAGESDDRGGDFREHPLPSAPPAPPYVLWA